MNRQHLIAQANGNSCEFAGDLGRSVLNSLSAHIAILDHHGVIIETNRAWQAFADLANGATSSHFIGVNYLSICDAVAGEDATDAQAVATGIRSVIRGDVEEFLYDYPCHTPYDQHWYYMRAIRMETVDPVKIIVSHEEITQLKLIEAALKHSKQALEEQKQNLEEANIALKVLLKQRETDKLELEQKVLTNLKDLVFPYLEKLKRAPLRHKDKTTLGIIENHLKDIISPLLQNLSNINILLTPQEMHIATLVRDGRSSKEIADILNVSQTTIHFHRKNLRHKLGIKNESTNLRSYLMSMG